jgi:hypothetical protein
LNEALVGAVQKAWPIPVVALSMGISGCGHHPPDVGRADACLRRAHVHVQRFDEAEPEGRLVLPHRLTVQFSGGVTAFVGFYASTYWAKRAQRSAVRHPEFVSPERRGKTVLWYSAGAGASIRRTLESCAF